MLYKLGDEISFCWAGDRAVFLDARQDRYFCLGRATEAMFRKLCADEGAKASDVCSLVALKVIDTPKGLGAPLKAVDHIKPARSGLEDIGRARSLNAALALKAAFAVVAARRQLRQRSFLDIIRRRRANKQKLEAADTSATAATLELSQAFAVARRVTPIPPICLPDSLALLDVLARRSLAADLVFGVKLNPFAAHCWVQSGDVVLNDTMDAVRRHTAILVV